MKSDKRKFLRFRSVKMQVEFARHLDQNFSSVQIVDVSTAGLCFLTNTQVMINNRLNFKFQFGFEILVMSGRVARINGREVGVKFTNSEIDVIKFINSYNDEAERISKETPDYKFTRIYPEKHDNRLTHDSIKKILDIDL